mgnify:FL=1
MDFKLHVIFPPEHPLVPQILHFGERIHGLKFLLDESQQRNYGLSVRSKEILTTSNWELFGGKIYHAV